MAFWREISPLNKFLFFPPNPSSYCIENFRGELCNLDGVLCLALPSYNPSSHVIIYSHGNASDIGHCRRYLVRLRDRLGMHVIAVEYPGYGVSAGNPSEGSVDRSLQRVFNFVHSSLKWPKESIILMGRSIGTGPAIKLAAQETVGSLILLAAFTSIKAVAELMLGKAAVILLDRWTSIESIEQVDSPLLLIHGSADRTIPAQHSIELYNACQHEKKDIQIFENLDHNRYNWKHIIQRLEDFFQEYGIRDPSMLHRSLTIPRECFEEWGDHGKLQCGPPDMWAPIRNIYLNVTASNSTSKNKKEQRVGQPVARKEEMGIVSATGPSVPFTTAIETPQLHLYSITGLSSENIPKSLPYNLHSSRNRMQKDFKDEESKEQHATEEYYDDQVFAEEKFRHVKLPSKRTASQSPQRRQTLGTKGSYHDRSRSALPAVSHANAFRSSNAPKTPQRSLHQKGSENLHMGFAGKQTAKDSTTLKATI